MTIAPERAAVIILAAGQSRRFGPANKIAASLRGRPLGLHIADTLAALPFAVRFAVIGEGDPGFAACGYQLVVNRDPGLGMSHSLKLGVSAVMAWDVDALLVVLGDMPLVPLEHIDALLDRFDGEMLATRSGDHVSPPAIFPRSSFDALMSLEGDAGARTLLRAAAAIDAPARWLADVDTPDDLARIG